MPRNASGTYTLANSAFAPQTTISSTAMNGDLNDIATALTQSLATTGVSSMTGPILAASGSVAAPSMAFASNPKTGFWLAGSNQIGWAANGVQGATFNNDTSVTWAGNQSIGGTLGVTGLATFSGGMTVAASQTATFNNSTFAFGAGAGAGFYTGIAGNFSVEYVIDGGGSVIGTGNKGFIECPFAGTIQRVTLIADQSGSIVVDIWKSTYAAGPPTVANTITASDLPTLSSAQKSQDSALTGWNKSIAAGDIIAYNVNSATTVTRVVVSLLVQRTGL